MDIRISYSEASNIADVLLPRFEVIYFLWLAGKDGKNLADLPSPTQFETATNYIAGVIKTFKLLGLRSELELVKEQVFFCLSKRYELNNFAIRGINSFFK